MALPVWYNPMTKPMVKWMSHQGGNCRDFEMDFYRCSSRTGPKKAAEICSAELEDLSECITKSKEFQRAVTMYRERKKQGKPFAKPPAGDVAGISK
ncbi:NADH dehydrogenase [ubiquinone] iron-sulfur protein 5-B-like [Gigantopelta aegis]|uniref:NADH dehydrogenase [ubiquinone] iron-sulfur protein 5-B-like n=1 Tax=Gigantopelta aegis TaxID=1735272 RepID=UPI001B888807|nr:NADH dehydrogenase [ubiquinone] iron-sulfur protein 5-B-like [Gigantopelta aegis]